MRFGIAKLLLRGVLAAAVVVVLLIALALTRLAWLGFDVARGLSSLASPTPAAVLDNPQLPQVDAYQVTWQANLTDLALNESSGLTSSQRVPDLLWSINDSGGGPELFAVGLDGHTYGRYTVNTDADLDWEALDSFTDKNGVSYLVIGDIGDNLNWRPYVDLLLVVEPHVSLASHNLAWTESEYQPSATLPVARQVRVTYPDGARDSEAMAVDLARERILLLSKRDQPPELYAVGLYAEGEVIADHIATLEHFPMPTEADFYMEPRQARYKYMPSGMDVMKDNLLITTYQPLFLFALSDLSTPPLELDMPRIGQREAISFLNDSETEAVLTRERRKGTGPAELFTLELLMQPTESERAAADEVAE